MQDSTWVGIMSMRTQAANALILPFVLMHSVVLVITPSPGMHLVTRAFSWRWPP